MVTRIDFIVAAIPEEHMDSESGFCWSNGSQIILKSIASDKAYIHENRYIQEIKSRNTLRGGLPWS